ncbi:MAG: hypothetical protein ACLP2P_16005 [Desulfobaccales bacterium]
MSKIELPKPHPAITRTRDELIHLEKFVDICVRALEQSTHAVQMVDICQRASKVLGDTPLLMTEKELREAKKRASEVEVFSKKQKEDGFPYLYSLAVVRLWGILEAMVDDIVVDFMHRPDKCKDKDLLYSLKGPLLEFATASPEQQADFLTERLKDAVKAGLQPGVGRFEAMLEPIGLGGGIDHDVRRVLFELSQVRNAIVHKVALADRRFVEACPWLNLKRGGKLKVNGGDFHLYMLSALYYALELSLRTLQLSGYEPTEQRTKLLPEIASTISQLWSNRIEAGKPEALLTADR